MHSFHISLLFLTSFLWAGDALGLDIEWKLYLKPTMKYGPIMTTITREGEPFVINHSGLTGNISGSEELVSALVNTSFILQKSPVNNPLSIHIILNVNGNDFESVMGINLCMNAKIETYVGGVKEERQDFYRNNPIIMTIPSGSGLNYLLQKCNSQRNEAIFVYYPGGKFDRDGIDTSSQVLGLTAYIRYQSVVVGGNNKDLGFPSNVNTSTWSSIKKLFE